jgi:serine phosphatase RsbU (regulator of sigma subunit)
MTLTVLEIDEFNGRMKLARAGAPPICLTHASSEIKVLGGVSKPLGEGSMQLSVEEAQLQPGDRLWVFTDGMYEFPCVGNQQQLGLKRLSKLFSQIVSSSAMEARNQIVQSLDQLRGSAPLPDDMTLVVAEL